MKALAIVIAALAGIYLIWRVRFGAPPAGWPQILCFHKISEKFCWEGTWTTPERFFAIIDRLVDRGFEFITMDGYLASIGEQSAVGHESGPSERIISSETQHRPLLLTFDDGYAELFDLVLPGLESRGVPFHVFLVSDYVGKDNAWDLSLGRRPFQHLNWIQIGEMTTHGVTFGSHGASHADLTRLDPASVREELGRSKAEIEDRTGEPVKTLSYPFGRYNEAVAAIARDLGYEAAFSLYPSHSNAQFRRFAIRRNGVYVVDTPALVELKLSSGPLFWLEETKCRVINGVAVVTPTLKRYSKARPSGRAREDGRGRES